jgi:PAS domain S-box-containing protein
MLDTPDADRPETLASELKEYRSEILDDWMAAKLSNGDPARTDIPAEAVRAQTGDLLDEFIALVEHGDLEDENTAVFRAVADSLAQIAFAQAAAGMSIGEIGNPVCSLRDALSNHRGRHGGHTIAPLRAVIDRLVLGMLEAYVALREGFINSIIESAADGIVTISGDATIQIFNAAAKEMFGYQASEVIGHNVKILMPSPYHEQHDGYLERFLRTGEARILGFRREVEGRRKDGSVFPMDLGVREVALPGIAAGQRIFSGVLRDLTELKAAQAEILRKSQDILELSTPVLSVWKDILVLPLIGTLDTRRTKDTMEKALTCLAAEKARILIIDITGVPIIDTMVADHRVRLAAAVQMMGASA